MIETLFGDWPLASSHRGWPRRMSSNDGWWTLGERLRHRSLSLLGLWGDREVVHAAFYKPDSRETLLASLPVSNGKVPSLAAFHPPALRLERALQDLYGIKVTGLPDGRPWLDHGLWAVSAPSAVQASIGSRAYQPEFLAAEGPSLHQIPVGPVHAGIIEPGHFRFTAHGETVVRLEERLGYVHKGVEKLMEGRSIADAARVAARVSGDSTVAYSWAFHRAVEQALGIEVTPRASWLRAVMAELERIANHLGDIGAICNDASFALMQAECGILRERVLRAAAMAFGHRLMMDRIVLAGVAADLSDAGIAAIRNALGAIGKKFPELIELYDNTASLQDRTVATGVVKAELALEYASGGYVGRASGRDFDARRELAYAPYDVLPLEIPLFREGDVDARVRVRMAEVQASERLLQTLLDHLPGGDVQAGVAAAPGSAVESTALVEGFRGDILAYVRITPELRIERCHLRDPSWFQWPLLEAAIEGNIVADFPLCNKSFNCSYSGHDL